MGCMPYLVAVQRCSPSSQLTLLKRSHLRLGIRADQHCASVSGTGGRTRAGELAMRAVVRTGALRVTQCVEQPSINVCTRNAKEAGRPFDTSFHSKRHPVLLRQFAFRRCFEHHAARAACELPCRAPGLPVERLHAHRRTTVAWCSTVVCGVGVVGGFRSVACRPGQGFSTGGKGDRLGRHPSTHVKKLHGLHVTYYRVVRNRRGYTHPTTLPQS